MKPAPFEIERPTRLDDVLRLLAANTGDARVIAGGQSLVPLMNLRMATPSLLIDLNRVEALQGIRVDGPWLRIGAMTRQQRLLSDPLIAAHAPLLARALPHIGHVQTRNRGTIGGSLAHADPSAELPVCMVALGATLSVGSASGGRTIPAREFFTDILSTTLQPDEVLVEIAIPRAPPGTRAWFIEFARRHGDLEQGRDPSRHAVLHVERSAPVEVAVLLDERERVPRPVRALRGNDIEVPDQQHGAPSPATSVANDEVPVVDAELEELAKEVAGRFRRVRPASAASG